MPGAELCAHGAEMTVCLPQSRGRHIVLFTGHIISHLPFSNLCDKIVLHQTTESLRFFEKTTQSCAVVCGISAMPCGAGLPHAFLQTARCLGQRTMCFHKDRTDKLRHRLYLRCRSLQAGRQLALCLRSGLLFGGETYSFPFHSLLIEK